MDLFFLVPPIHGRPTGGNIYNRRIVTELQVGGDVKLVPWSPPSSGPSPLPASTSSPVVVDSLLLRHSDALRALRRSHPSSRIILLAHYLHCIDPRRSNSSQASGERSILPVFDGAVTTSQYAKTALINEGVSDSTIRVIPPGLDETYRMTTAEHRSGNPPELLSVANLLPGKGLLHLLEILDTLSEESWRWTVIGDDSLDPDFADRLRNRLDAAQLTDRITGPKTLSPNALRSTYDRADIFILPSRFETCSMAMREAMARGLPVVGYRVGGIPENFGGKTAGRLVDPDDPAGLRDAIRMLITDSALRRDLGMTAQLRSQSFPTWRESAIQFRRFLKTLESSDQ